MAPKARAKAKAQALRLQVKNEKRGARRAALTDLNALAVEVGAAKATVDPRAATAAQVHRAIRVLEVRCRQPPLSERLRAVVEKWAANGGPMQADLAPPPDLDTAAAVA